MIYRPWVWYYHTSICMLCAAFEKEVLSPYESRNDVFITKIEVGPNMFIEGIEGVMPSMLRQSTKFKQIFLSLGNKPPARTHVPAVTILTPQQVYDFINRPWVEHVYTSLFPGDVEVCPRCGGKLKAEVRTIGGKKKEVLVCQKCKYATTFKDEFFRMVRRTIDRMILRKAYIVTPYIMW